MSWKCPKCGSTNLSVTIRASAKLHQDTDNFETEVDGADHEWSESSAMTCDDCRHHSVALDFEEGRGTSRTHRLETELEQLADAVDRAAVLQRFGTVIREETWQELTELAEKARRVLRDDA